MHHSDAVRAPERCEDYSSALWLDQVSAAKRTVTVTITADGAFDPPLFRFASARIAFYHR